MLLMGRLKDLTLVSRNQKIREMKERGYTYGQISEETGISRARVSQILAEMDEEVSGDGYRAWLRAQGETGLSKLQDILRAPPPVKISASGKPVYELDDLGEPDFGKPVPDVSVHIDAAKALPAILDRLSKMGGLDRHAPKPADETPEFDTAWAWAQEQAVKAKELAARLSQYEDGDGKPIPEADVIEDHPQ